MKAQKAKKVTKAPLKKVVKKTLKPSKAPTPDMAKMKALVINLDRRPDRWEKVSKSLAEKAPWLAAERFRATDGAKDTIPVKDVPKKWVTTELARYVSWYRPNVKLDLSPGERGFSMSHVRAWRFAAAQKGPTIVLEDDGVLMKNFSDQLSKALKEVQSLEKPLDILMLSSKDRFKSKKIGACLAEAGYVWTTVGYVVWPHGAKKMLSMLPCDIPVDNFIAYYIKEGKLNGLIMKPAVVRQANTWNVGSDVGHSDDAAWW